MDGGGAIPRSPLALVSTIILARVFVPEDFGLVDMAAFVLALLSAFGLAR